MEGNLPDEKPTILCVDDETIPLTLRKSVLEKSGFHVIAVDTGKRALEILDREKVDLVLTDFLMPGISGTELAREIKRRQPRLPVVLFSGVNEIPEDSNSADYFLSKVEGPAVMCKKLAEMLSRRHGTEA
jgi:CheY-like chemotaxis protein